MACVMKRCSDAHHVYSSFTPMHCLLCMLRLQPSLAGLQPHTLHWLVSQDLPGLLAGVLTPEAAKLHSLRWHETAVTVLNTLLNTEARWADRSGVCQLAQSTGQTFTPAHDK